MPMQNNVEITKTIVTVPDCVKKLLIGQKKCSLPKARKTRGEHGRIKKIDGR